MIGGISLNLALAAVSICLTLYIMGQKYRAAAGWAFRAHALMMVIASIYMVFILLTHRFEYHYVYSHTCRNLPWGYLFSALWAGQEGSYLFWALCGSLVGLFLLRREENSHTLAIFAVGQLFLLALLVQAQPFQLMATVPADGTGLNPLLLDPWMVVHPPLVFLGYALLFVPAAASLSDLIQGKYQDLPRMLPWTLLGWLMLGAGIFLGGVWAYKVLGWGGYWSWDPVENSSLIPWLTATALVHGLLWQRQKGTGIRGNLLLAIITWVMILFAAFLTRSGIMSDYSVHAFAETPLTRLLAGFLLFFAVAGLSLFAWRVAKILDSPNSISPFTQEGRFFLARWILWAGAILVLLGTLAPIITGFMGTPASVDISFYYQTLSPLAWLLLLLLGFASASPRDAELALYTMLPGVVVSLMLGVTSFLALIFLAAAAFALAANILTLFRKVKSGTLVSAGASLAHSGFALMLAGVLMSTAYSQGEIVQLIPGQQTEVLGYHLTLEPITGGIYSIGVEAKGKERIVTPSIATAGQQVMREPGILRYIHQDLYISPLETGYIYPDQLTIGLGRFAGFGDYSIQFNEFLFDDHQAGGDIEITAVLSVRIMGAVYTLTPTIRRTSTGQESIGVPLPDSNNFVYLRKVEPAQELVVITIGPELSPGKKTLYVEVKTKPLISVLALGVALVLLGTGFAVGRRLKQ